VRGDALAGWARALTVVAVVVAADQVTKALARSAVDRGHEESIFFGVDLVNVRNKGIAFGLFGDGGSAVVIVTVAAVALLIVWFAVNAGRPLLWLPTGLLLGGAAGNLIDRVRDGSVTDFIDVPFWPAFNLADVAITFGVLSLLYVLEPAARKRGDPESDTA
jgi:signal peptidase II